MNLRRISIILLLIAVMISGSFTAVYSPAEAAEASSGPLRMMTFNLRYAAAKDEQPWEKRRPVMKELIMQEKPDVIGTQEGLYHQLSDLQADLPEYDWIGIGREGGNLGEHMAVFYNKARVLPLEHSHFWLSDTPNLISSTGWGNRIPRMVTWVRFQDISTGKTFYFVNTHLDHQSEAAREKSAQLILDRMAEFDPEVPVILTGDFNTSPDGEVYHKLTGEGGLQDAFSDAKRRVNDHLGTFHNYKDPTGGGCSRRIDWILYSGKINVLRGEIVTFHLDGQYPSDHYPVMVDVILQKASKSTEETVPKATLSTSLLITEVVPNSREQGSYNYVEIYNNTDREIDLEGYQIYYYYDPALPFDKSKSNKWTITKDSFSISTIIRPQETKVVWIKKQPCCYDLGMDEFLANYGLTEEGLPPEQLLSVFTPGENQGLNGTSDSGRSLGIVSPDGAHLIGVQYNKGILDVGVNESITYTVPDPLSSIMRKQANHQTPTPGSR
ncbi:endonuclease/exonuclease/phosphatase family protein [Paenibacillus sp. J2TS4]|uniref:endonuclease/exonuclease/phosphatase family protein n=1 Tax=Paenibacillus sp. J2TS4 TaxID=2807194 RepID=UPI001B2C5EE2|nr:endonuclease/exonuclease/phosphatase family protein [Paenibacillus sp. J2TS4]GIP31224.1 hypothetical protein J2TS4_04340 [Paenibacillus sp. J2TS4]